MKNRVSRRRYKGGELIVCVCFITEVLGDSGGCEFKMCIVCVHEVSSFLYLYIAKNMITNR